MIGLILRFKGMVKKIVVTTDRQTARASDLKEAHYMELMAEKCTENLKSLIVIARLT